jgi:uncharacterized membrane protein
MSEPGVPPPPPTYNPPPPPPSGTAPTVSPNRKLMIVLSYIWILFIVPLIAEKDDPEVQWHAKHGMLIFFAEIAAYIAIFVVRVVLDHVWGGFGCALILLRLVVGIGFLVLRILCILKGVNGERFIIPGLTQYVSRF